MQHSQPKILSPSLESYFFAHIFHKKWDWFNIGIFQLAHSQLGRKWVSRIDLVKVEISSQITEGHCFSLHTIIHDCHWTLCIKNNSSFESYQINNIASNSVTLTKKVIFKTSLTPMVTKYTYNNDKFSQEHWKSCITFQIWFCKNWSCEQKL